MCGFAGFINSKADLSETELAAIGTRMHQAINFRGPDDSGLWIDPAVSLTFAHRRLSILDLSPEGHQPMISESGRYVMIYNGEIYNFNEIQNELGIGKKYRSDTKVMLAAFERWGITEATKRFNGIFAYAVWDAKDRSLSLARDPLGIKPLYYGWQTKSGRQTFLFGSDSLAFRSHPEFEGVENSAAVGDLLRFGFIPAPHSIYSGIYKLIPGKVLTLNQSALKSPSGTFDPELQNCPTYSKILQTDQPSLSPETAIDELTAIIRNAVKRQLISDVPVGAFLSGGIDSSLVVAMMREATSNVNTFSIGFDTDGYDETKTAARIAELLGTNHTKFYLTEQEVIAQVPDMLAKLGEPHGDPSIIPTALVSKLAKQHVTVALSGDGGDELFGGYNRYLFPSQVWKLRFVPKPLRQLMIAALKVAPPSLTSSIPGLKNVSRLNDRLGKIERMLCTPSIHSAYLTLLESNSAVHSHRIPDALSRAMKSKNMAPEQIWMLFDQLFYLADDNLSKVDRASMAHSLEVRVPLLDDEVVKLSHRVPLNFKMRDGQTKWILRQILGKFIPQEIVDLPKTGFTPPLPNWLRGPLKSWGDELIGQATDLPGLSSTSQRQIWNRLQTSGHTEDAALMWNTLVYWDWKSRTQ